MTRVRLSQRAVQDLEEIGRFTQRHWGIAQRRAYIGAIATRCEGLSKSPQIGISRETIRPGLRSFRSERHVIFYRLSDGDILISRILHEAMDLNRQDFDET